MCGRTACTLSKENIQKACCVRDPKSKKYKELKWVDVPNGGRTYRPSFNVCPTDVTPVMVAGDNGVLELKPMIWGMIPPWHKGSWNTHKLSTNNCRIENILESRLYKGPLMSGKRCVVVYDGFYEWQTTKAKSATKQPYFVYAPQPEGVRIDEPETWSLTWSPEKGWLGPRLLHMAALYNTWTSPEGEEMWSYSVVTMESSDTLSWMHNRTPAILDSESAVIGWLDDGHIDPKERLALLTPNVTLLWHPVDSRVNSARDKSDGLNRAIDLNEPKKPSRSASMMESWLRSGTKPKTKPEADEPTAKQTKKRKTS